MEEITILWQTDEVRAVRPRVVDEIRHGLWFFEESLFDAGERLLRDYRRRVPGARPPFSFGTWIGGDPTATRRSAATRSPWRSSGPARPRSSATAATCAS